MERSKGPSVLEISNWKMPHLMLYISPDFFRELSCGNRKIIQSVGLVPSKEVIKPGFSSLTIYIFKK